MDKQNFIYLVLGLLLLILGLLAFSNSNFFQVDQLIIDGNKLLKEEYIIDYTDVIAKNIFKIDRQELADKLLKLPQIKGVAIDRYLPNQLQIRINERRAVAIIGVDSSYQIIDKEGWILATTKNLSYWKLPLITGVEVLKEKRKVESSQAFKLAIDYLGLLATDTLEGITELNISKEKGVELFLDDDGVVKLGKNFDINKKSEIFSTIYQDLKNKDRAVEYIDLRYKENVVVKLAD